MYSRQLDRRGFLALGALATAAAFVPARADAAAGGPLPEPGPGPADRMLSFYNIHTDERLKTQFCCEGRYVPEALSGINHILRDFRANEVKAIDTRLLDLLHRLQGELATDQAFHVISGYRSPGTNAMLRARGGANTGVASRSLHMDGKAIDIRVPGVKLAALHRAALALKGGGVGYYPASDFVHVDVGRVRTW
jgi:uncharacterized protein YcbK (DUF882 family)